MKVEAIVNGSVTFVLIPETELDKILIKQFAKQTIELVEFSKQTAILNKQFTEGLIIQQKVRVEVDAENKSIAHE